jgi:pimeloyl-ACP methyl ester carboxylesterase
MIELRTPAQIEQMRPAGRFVADVITALSEAADVGVPVRWWHGDDDHIVPFRHGQHLVDRLPDATLKVIDGESHLGGLGIAEEVLTTLMELGPRRSAPKAAKRR